MADPTRPTSLRACLRNLALDRMTQKVKTLKGYTVRQSMHIDCSLGRAIGNHDLYTRCMRFGRATRLVRVSAVVRVWLCDLKFDSPNPYERR